MNHTVPPKDVDLRAFTYGAQPYLNVQQWRLDALRNKLAVVQTDIDAVTDTMRKQRETITRQTESVRTSLLRGLNVHAHQNALAYLAGLSGMVIQLEDQLHALQAQRQEIQSDCVAQEKRLEGIQEHRATALKAYALESRNREAAQADGAWIAKDHWSKAQIRRLTDPARQEAHQ